MGNKPEMKKQSNINSFSDFGRSVADYIDYEYGESEFYNLSSDEKATIYQIVVAHYDHQDSVNNVANDIIHYLRASRSWEQSKGISNDK